MSSKGEGGWGVIIPAGQAAEPKYLAFIYMAMDAHADCSAI